MDLTYDDIGKIDLSDIYDCPDPVRYFSTLSKLDYRVPQEAKAAFSRIIGARRAAQEREAIKLVDVGCSYGVNAALLKHDITIEDLNRHYSEAPPLGRDQLVERDRRFFGEADAEAIEVVGLDVAQEAVRYAVDAGVLDHGIVTDLENDDLAPVEAARLRDVDLIISTGCYGYVTRRTFEQILGPCVDRQPWLANMVLRMFDYSPAESMFEDMGYVTEKVPGLVPQRRFASPEERHNVLDNLAQEGIDASRFEETGWYFAELYVSRPRSAAVGMPIGEVVPRVGRSPAN